MLDKELQLENAIRSIIKKYEFTETEKILKNIPLIGKYVKYKHKKMLSKKLKDDLKLMLDQPYPARLYFGFGKQQSADEFLSAVSKLVSKKEVDIFNYLVNYEA